MDIENAFRIFEDEDPCYKCITFPLCKNRMTQVISRRINEVKKTYYLHVEGKMNQQLSEDIYRSIIIEIFRLYNDCPYISDYHTDIIIYLSFHNHIPTYHSITNFNKDSIRILKLIDSFNLQTIKYVNAFMYYNYQIKNGKITYKDYRSVKRF